MWGDIMTDKKLGKRLIVLGFDGFDYKFLQELLNEVPWKKFKDYVDICWANVRSIRPCKFDSGMLWTTIFSGVHPDIHGVYGYRKAVNGNYDGPPLKYNELLPAGYNFVWDAYTDIKWACWQIPIMIPPYENMSFKHLKSNNDSCVIMEFDEWKKGVRKVLETDFDISICVFSGTDQYSHFHWNDFSGMINLYQQVGIFLDEIIEKDDNFLILSDHGFTDIDFAIKQGWTWANSKIKNGDIGHHAPHGLVISDLSPRPFTTLEIVPTIVHWIERKRLLLSGEKDKKKK